jgi:hypothetical protein
MQGRSRIVCKDGREYIASLDLVNVLPSECKPKMAAMTLSIYECITPRSAIGLIDALLAEISFLEESMSPTERLDRLLAICDGFRMKCRLSPKCAVGRPISAAEQRILMRDLS